MDKKTDMLVELEIRSGMHSVVRKPDGVDLVVYDFDVLPMGGMDTVMRGGKPCMVHTYPGRMHIHKSIKKEESR